MRFTKILLLGLLFTTELITAQTNFEPGFIIDTKRDTLYGEIDYRGDLLMSKICKFKDSQDKITEYHPNDITAFRFIDSKYYVSRKVNQKSVFLEYLIKGEINIYYMRDDDGDHYFLEKEGIKLTEIPYEESIQYVDGKKMLYESTTHMGLLYYYMQDAPQFQSRIQTIKKPEHRSLIKLAEDYHNAVCEEEGEKCIIYEKKLPLIKVTPSAYMGLIKYKSYDNFTREFGGYVSFWAPRTSEKLFFRTGMIYNKLPEEGEEIDVFKIPLQFQYIFRAHKFQPNVSAGINFLTARLNNYKEISHTFSLNAGLDYKISNQVYLSTIVGSEFTPLSKVALNDSLGFGLISYSINAGIRFDL